MFSVMEPEKLLVNLMSYYASGCDIDVIKQAIEDIDADAVMDEIETRGQYRRGDMAILADSGFRDFVERNGGL